MSVSIALDDVEKNSTGNTAKDGLDWYLNEDKRLAREKSLWYGWLQFLSIHTPFSLTAINSSLQLFQVLESSMRTFPPFPSDTCVGSRS